MTGFPLVEGYPHIAVCIDSSPAAEDALAEARALRALSPGRLSLVHVAVPPRLRGYSRWEPPDAQSFVSDAREWLQGIVATHPGTQPVLLHGDRPARLVVEWAAEANVDLLVVASHGNLLERAGLGGFSRHVAYSARSPVLIVRRAAGK